MQALCKKSSQCPKRGIYSSDSIAAVHLLFSRVSVKLDKSQHSVTGVDFQSQNPARSAKKGAQRLLLNVSSQCPLQHMLCEGTLLPFMFAFCPSTFFLRRIAHFVLLNVNDPFAKAFIYSDLI